MGRLESYLEGLGPTVDSQWSKVRLHEATSRLHDPIFRLHGELNEVMSGSKDVPWLHVGSIWRSFWIDCDDFEEND